MRRKPPLKRGLGGIHGVCKGIEYPQMLSEFSVMVARPPHPLDGCWAKIERVKEQIRHLNGEIAALTNSGVYSIAGENQPERHRYAFKLLGPATPPRIAVIAGEIVHHLRSCFDYVVWALARKNGLPDSERANFPVCQTREKFRNAVRDGIIKGVSISEHPLIEALQPYRSPDPPNSILQIVHDLDITDKHRLSVVVTHALEKGNTLIITKNDCPDPEFGIELPPAVVGRQGQFIGVQYPWAIEDGIEVHWIPLRGPPNPEFEMTANSTIQIAFEQVGTLRRQPVVQVLMQLCNGVEAAIQTFEGCF